MRALALVLVLTACTASRTLTHDVVASVDTGDAIVLALDDGSVVSVPDDPAAGVERVGAIPRGLVIRQLDATAGFALTVSSGAPGLQAHALSRLDHSVRGLAAADGLLGCAWGASLGVLQRRQDGRTFAQRFDGAALAVGAEGILDTRDTALQCEGDARGLVVDLERDELYGGGRDLYVLSGPNAPLHPLHAGWPIAWRLGPNGSVIVLREGDYHHGSIPELWRVERGQGAPAELQHALEHATRIEVGETHVCVSDADTGPGRIRRVALATGATDTLLEGVRARCLGVRGDHVVVLREGREVVLLPP